MTKAPPTLDTIQAAAGAIAGIAVKTPMVASELAALGGAGPLWLKLETTQPTGSFKIRGATNAIANLTEEERSRGIVCCSTGNHGRAVAYAAQALGCAATVCLSGLVPAVKVRAIESLGAKIIKVGKSQDDAQREVDRLVKDDDRIEIPPFDHADVIAGQGTIAIEMLDAQPELATLLVPLSGGGLISGIAIAAKAIKPSIRIIGLTMERGAAMAASLDKGEPVEIEEYPSLADSLGGGIGLQNQYTFSICKTLLDDVVLLTEKEIYQGMRALFYDERLVAEGAAAVGHAAVLSGKVIVNGPTATVVSGRNVDTQQLAHIVAGKPVALGDALVTGD